MRGVRGSKGRSEGEGGGVNYYERHIGDYLKDTAHLTLLEHGIYTRLMDVYYTREGPIPAADVVRLIGARSKDEREALRAVLAEFFELVEGAHVQARCDREIERFKDKQAKAKRSANARWERDEAHTERNANASADAMRTHSEGNAPRARPQTPDTRHLRSKATSVVASKPRPAKKAPPDLALTDDLRAWAAEHAPAVDADAELAKLKDHTFARARTDWPGTLRNWLRKAQEDAQERAKRMPKASNGSQPEPEWRREQRERNEAFLGPAAARRSPTTIDAETRDATPDLLG